MVQVGDTVRIQTNAKLAVVKRVGVSSDCDRPENCQSIVRLPDGDTLVLLQWKHGGGPSYAGEPNKYMVVPERILHKQ